MRVRALTGTDSEAIYIPELDMGSGRCPSSPLALSHFSYSLSFSREPPLISTCPRISISDSVSRETTAALHAYQTPESQILLQGTQRPVGQGQRHRHGYHSEYECSNRKACGVPSDPVQGRAWEGSDSLGLNSGFPVHTLCHLATVPVIESPSPDCLRLTLDPQQGA